LTRLRARDGKDKSAEPNEVGIVTSSAFSPAANAAIGMAYVRRDYNSAGSILDFDGGTATVVAATNT
jgi:glycine cleavage system aminomethyltransferase T